MAALTFVDTSMIEKPTIFPELSVASLRVGSIPGSTTITGNLTVYGQLTALSGFNVVIASTTSTSALSVSNLQATEALNVYQGPAYPIIGIFRSNSGNVLVIRDTGLTISGNISGNNLTTSFNQGSATGNYSFATNTSKALGLYSHAEGENTTAAGVASHSEGINTIAHNTYTHAEGYNTIASGIQSHAEGRDTTSSGNYSHAEGYYTSTGNRVPFAAYNSATKTFTFTPTTSAQFDYLNQPTNTNLILKGYEQDTLGNYFTTTVVSRLTSNGAITVSTDPIGANATNGWLIDNAGNFAHAEGYTTQSSGRSSHAEGEYTVAYGRASHAGGFRSTAAQNYTYAWSDGNLGNATANLSTTKTGQYMVSASGGVFIPGRVGIGTDSTANALTVNGNISASNTLSALNFFITGNGSLLGQTSATSISIGSLSARSLSLIHDPANDGVDPILDIGETLSNSFSGFRVRYEEPTNRLMCSSRTGTTVLTSVIINVATGQVGISGNPAPGQALTVVGNISATGNIFSRGTSNVTYTTPYNYLASGGTNNTNTLSTLFVVPAGYTYLHNTVFATIDAVAGGPITTDTLPTIYIVRGTGGGSTTRLTDVMTLSSNTGTMLVNRLYTRGSQATNDPTNNKPLTLPGDSINVIIGTAYVAGSTPFTTLSGRVTITGSLIPV